MPIYIEKTITKLPRGRFRKILDHLLGPDYELTLVFVGSLRARTLNQKNRGKSYVPNVLSFPLSPTCGEIYICPAAAEREADDFGLTPTGYLEYLCIHGAAHLLGYTHGRKMDAFEAKVCNHFSLHHKSTSK